MKDSIKRAIPVSVLDWAYRRRMRFRIGREFRRDSKRYAANAAFEDRVMPGRMSDSAIEVQATKDYHRVEKALTLGAPKRPFGARVEARMERVQPLVPQGSVLSEYVSSARSALSAWNSNGMIDDLVSPMAGSTHGLSTSDVEEFFSTRHSVRNFDSNRSVDISVLEDAARLAMFTPSVCNRQASKVYFVTSEEMKAIARKRQNGNTGFGDIPVLAVVTVDTRLFAGPGERNQPWIDGGLFAMSLAWALHGVGLSSCMLNMSVTNSVSDALRRDLQIEQHEVVIMQLAIGYPADGYRVARSPRRELGDVVRIVG